MGRPKIKDINSDIDLEKVELPKEESEILTKPVEETSEPTEKKVKAKSKTTKEKVEKKTKPSKRYSDLYQQIDRSTTYSISEAVKLIKKTANTKFDSTVEAHFNLQIDPSKQEQQIRTTARLPKGSGKKINVIVFGAKDTSSVKESGALVGTEESLDQIEKGKINFDNPTGGKITKLSEIQKVVSSPDWMPKLARVAKVLGPKGLMPNPKSGTVSPEPEKVAAELNSGMIEIKTETSPIIHVTVGKSSFKEEDLEENIRSLLESVKAAKPAEVKKELIKSVYITSTMGPSVRVETTTQS